MWVSYYWWLAIPGLILGVYAQFKLSAAYSRYSEVGSGSGLSGAEAAREILDRTGLRNIPVEEVPGRLTDHFDPVRRALFLSSENFHGRSIAAVGVGAHETGHALQQQAAYSLFRLRMAVAPATQFASYGYSGIVLLGWFLGGALFSEFLLLAIVLFAVITFFQIVTLPVEFDASQRAEQQLAKLGLVQGDEAPAIHDMLNAAALTYVAAMLTAILQLLQLILLFNRRRDRN